MKGVTKGLSVAATDIDDSDVLPEIILSIKTADGFTAEKELR